MNILYETEKLKLEFEHELVQLKEKSSGKILFEEEFYGSPNCGIIDSNNNWTIIGGIHLILWKPTQRKKYRNESFEWIHSLRIKNEKIVEILTDPWSENSSIWELNIENAELNKIKDFADYRNKEYTEFVEW
ncbi:hypothetical protein CJ739_3880 [Mariniflexile rhizosphaerae]|uniref:hypothetical protein n=1 Tax=unclassified Mariniflexile TaxID=2643887 RepID=UPI000E333DC7|nr:hypothetical protein [Mariniflexile sp. TRM1-10]AXP82939.1 hypothetical protein CJ739_3880 [Mariniflexile sp. TRM1-10]